MNNIIYELKSIIVGETITLPKSPTQLNNTISTKEVIVNSCAVVFISDPTGAGVASYRYDPIGLNIRYNQNHIEEPFIPLSIDDIGTGAKTAFGYKTLYEKYGIIYMFKCSKG
jgi:hypothetical protein